MCIKYKAFFQYVYIFSINKVLNPLNFTLLLTYVHIWIQSTFVYVICREIYLACYAGNAFVHVKITVIKTLTYL